MKKRQVVITGAGACGLMAAIMAARNGAAVTVLEQNEKPGKKICATGNGRCNFSNLARPDDAYRGEHPEFVEDALREFSVQNTIEFFKEIGIYPLNRNGYLYPRSNQAQSVVDVLCMEAASLGAKIKTNEQVTEIKTGTNGKNFQILTKGWHYDADALILANGSRASSVSGSDGSGYMLAESFHHRIVPVYPALTALKCKGSSFKAWAGVRTEGEISLFTDGKFCKSEHGELQLTEYGISGIPVFQLSTYAVRAVREGHKAELRINFMPELSEEELKKLLYARKIREFPLEVQDGMSFSQAQVCSGGVDTSQVNSQTMESKLCRGLYFAGELLDIDGTCGGYNLQWAWSSGAVAGKNAAKEEKN